MNNRNNHHLIFPANRYAQGAGRRFREHPSMQVDMPVETHNELHANISANLIIPTKQILGRAIVHISQYDLSDIKPTEVADDLADFMWGEDMTGLAQNLWYQIPYLAEGEYR